MSRLSDPRANLLLNEIFLHRRAAVAIFALVNLAAVIAAFAWPRGYTVSATILVSERNIIQPLMQGAAATTGVTDRAKIAREIINGRKVMNQVIEAANWVTPDTPQPEKEKVIASLNSRTTIANAGNNLIRIQFRDSEPDRAFLTTQTLADIFIKESIREKAAESQSAFEFIDRQTAEYHTKLVDMEERLKEFRIANIDLRGSEGDIGQRMTALQVRIEQSTQDLREAEIKKKSLEKQLSGEAESATALSREQQYRLRIAELSAQLETLRLTYHDTYPDVVRLRHQIEDLNEAVVAEKQRRDQAKVSGQIVIDDSVMNSPVYQQLKRDLSQTQITIDTLQARITEARQQLNSVLERGKLAQGGEATLAELTRDYQVTRDIYQDLLRRRESARVSMNMDLENQGLTFKIQEAATKPSNPGGLQFWHFLGLGLLLGISIPVGLVYVKLQVDPRLRLPIQLAERHQSAMLMTVPHLRVNSEEVRLRREMALLGMSVTATLGAVSFIFLLSLGGVI